MVLVWDKQTNFRCHIFDQTTSCERTKPRGYQHSVDALDGVTDAGHHGVNLLSQVVLSVQAEALLLLELLQGIGSLAGRQRGSVLKQQSNANPGVSSTVFQICTDKINTMFQKPHYLADDVGDRISSFDPSTPLRVDPQSHVDVREALLVWIILRVFGQCLSKREKASANLVVIFPPGNTIE